MGNPYQKLNDAMTGANTAQGLDTRKETRNERLNRERREEELRKRREWEAKVKGTALAKKMAGLAGIPKDVQDKY